MSRPAAAYAELHAHSAYSFLDGASSPAELAASAAELGLEALVLSDAGEVCRDAHKSVAHVR